jgi:tRNA threonylcarbamoyladenosine biosynthesis protein TsaE
MTHRLEKSSSAEETFRLGAELGRSLPPSAIVALFGDLGAGKTTFVKGLVSAITGLDPALINSPTFTYLHLYPTRPAVHHFDLYRLRTADEFLALGFDEYFSEEGIVCIEWAEKIDAILPKGTLSVHLDHAGEDRRVCRIVSR